MANSLDIPRLLGASEPLYRPFLWWMLPAWLIGRVRPHAGPRDRRRRDRARQPQPDDRRHALPIAVVLVALCRR